MSISLAWPTPARIREIAAAFRQWPRWEFAVVAAADLEIWAARLDAAGLPPPPAAIKWMSTQKGEVYIAVDEASERVLGYVEKIEGPAGGPMMWRWTIFDKTFLTAEAAKTQLEIAFRPHSTATSVYPLN